MGGRVWGEGRVLGLNSWWSEGLDGEGQLGFCIEGEAIIRQTSPGRLRRMGNSADETSPGRLRDRGHSADETSPGRLGRMETGLTK